MTLKMVIKVGTGILIVPLSLAAYHLWPWWCKASLPVKLLTGVFVLPFVGITSVVTSWWAGY